MAKNYAAELAEWIKKRDASKNRQDRNKLMFLTVRADVQSAIEEGYSLKTIWEHLSEIGKIPYRYETFIKHVKRYIQKTPTNPVQAEPIKTADTPQKPKKAATSIPTFTFKPTSNKEDLF